MGKGKTIGIGAGIAFGVILGIIAVAANTEPSGDENVVNSQPNDDSLSSMESTMTQQNEEIQNPTTGDLPAFNDDNVGTLFTNPDSYKNANVDVTGQLNGNAEREGDRTWFQISRGSSLTSDGQMIVYSDILNLSEFKGDDCVKVNGLNEGRIEGTNAFGATIYAVQVKADSVEKIACEEVFYPALMTIEVNEIQQAGNVKMTLQKVVFTEEHTRVYLVVENISSSSKAYFDEFNAVAFQGNRQFNDTFAFDVDFPEIEYEIFPGIREEGLVLFEPLDYTLNEARFHFETNGERFTDQHNFDFTVKL